MPSRTPRPASPGFTLVEIVVGLAIAALLLAAGVPAYGRFIAELELANAAHALAQAMSLARAEAIKHGGRVDVCKSSDQRTCTAQGGWESGWLVFLDEDRDGAPGADEAVVQREPPAGRGITARANQPLADYVSFTALGHARLRNGALQMGTFTVCRSGHRARRVVLAHSGRVRVERAPDLCP